MQKIFIFFGDGSNGKSTLLRIISNFMGEGNYSTLSMQDLETTFRPAELENKLVNIGDDIPVTTIKDSSMLKSLSAGERVTVERKNKPPFNLKNYAKLIFTTNKMPRVVDKSHGLYRRLILIPLDAKFSPSDPDFDPDIEQKVICDKAMSYLLNMAVRGYRRMMKHGFTKSEKVEKAIETFKVQNSNTLTWIDECDIKPEYLLSKNIKELYYEFQNYCESAGNKPSAQIGFTKEICNRFNFIRKRRRESGNQNVLSYFCA
jgi:putative DNA primase/helicase